jgi:hypothetical protein|tara:strand:- start:2734 stop:2886 length:153 start_codon:yes stop_codon:yes gene_type:complete
MYKYYESKSAGANYGGKAVLDYKNPRSSRKNAFTQRFWASHMENHMIEGV